jgi:KUP system potassium uptake protein
MGRRSRGVSKGAWALALSSLGIVFGDLGTSPLYALQECLSGAHGVPATRENVLGVLSLVVWSLIVVITIKYLAFLMRADQNGEGGIMVLLALLPERRRHKGHGRLTILALLTLFGAALLFGDGAITPAISVLSAVEGLGVATKALDPVVVPLTVAILVALFWTQHRGTGRLARYFGPIMLVWFLTNAVLGGFHLAHRLDVLSALSPVWGARFFMAHGLRGLHVLGGVVLAVTGGEALYADMGHFGRKPIQRAWIFVCLPALLLSYFGQGALLLAHPEAASRPFYAMCTHPAVLYPVVALASVATVIASQALISGVFSLVHQAVRLGFLPRMLVVHTSSQTEGQIYMPLPNTLLAIACIAIVLGFRSSASLAAAYGLAVSGTMAISTIVFAAVTRETFRWPAWKSYALLFFFLSFDLPFLYANAAKFLDGGWLPVLLATGSGVVMLNWYTGRKLLEEKIGTSARPLREFLLECERPSQPRLPGVAVFMTGHADVAPATLTRLEERFRVVHETNVLLTVATEHVPFVEDDRRASVQEIGHGFFRAELRYGFRETPDVPAGFEKIREQLGVRDEPIYVVGHATIVRSPRGDMRGLWESMFALASRNARTATDFYGLPPERVIEIGLQIDL